MKRTPTNSDIKIPAAMTAVLNAVCPWVLADIPKMISVIPAAIPVRTNFFIGSEFA